MNAFGLNGKESKEALGAMREGIDRLPAVSARVTEIDASVRDVLNEVFKAQNERERAQGVGDPHMRPALTIDQILARQTAATVAAMNVTRARDIVDSSTAGTGARVYDLDAARDARGGQPNAPVVKPFEEGQFNVAS